MTVHPIDTEALREWIESQRHHEGVTLHVSIESAGALLDLLAAAEHRATRAEAQAAIRGRAVVMYRERAREAEAAVENWRKQYEQDTDYWADAADAAEARIKAVRAIHRDLYESMSGVPYCDECDRAWPCPTIRALD